MNVYISIYYNGVVFMEQEWEEMRELNRDFRGSIRNFSINSRLLRNSEIILINWSGGRLLAVILAYYDTFGFEWKLGAMF